MVNIKIRKLFLLYFNMYLIFLNSLKIIEKSTGDCRVAPSPTCYPAPFRPFFLHFVSLSTSVDSGSHDYNSFCFVPNCATLQWTSLQYLKNLFQKVERLAPLVSCWLNHTSWSGLCGPQAHHITVVPYVLPHVCSSLFTEFSPLTLLHSFYSTQSYCLISSTYR